MAIVKLKEKEPCKAAPIKLKNKGINLQKQDMFALDYGNENEKEVNDLINKKHRDLYLKVSREMKSCSHCGNKITASKQFTIKVPNIRKRKDTVDDDRTERKTKERFENLSISNKQ